VLNLKRVGEAGASLSSELAANSAESSATAEEMAATVGSLDSKITALDENIRVAGDSVEAISAGIGEVERLAARQSGAVGETVAASRGIIGELEGLGHMAGSREPGPTPSSSGPARARPWWASSSRRSGATRRASPRWPRRGQLAERRRARRGARGLQGDG
jgi:hypothetical protein